MGRTRRGTTFATLVLFAVASALVSSAAAVRADPAPTLTVSPAAGLVDKQVVTIGGRGYTPGESVFLAQCEGAAFACDGTTIKGVTVDGSGAISTSFTVRHALRTTSMVPFDCLAAWGACRILTGYLVGTTGETLATKSLDFDSSVPTPPPPALTVHPSSGLADGELVQVHAAGFDPGEQVQVLECRVAPASPLPCSGSVPLDADGSGAVDVVYLARKLLGVAFQASVFGGPTLDPPVDCSSAGAECALFVTAVSDPVRTNWVPSSFDPAAPIAPSGLTASPLSGLRDGQIVTVTGQRASDEQILVAVCRAGAGALVPPTGPCAFVGGQNADTAGRVQFEFTARWISSQLDGRPLDCTPPAPCELLLFNSSRPSYVLDRLPLTFLDEGPSVPRFTG